MPSCCPAPAPAPALLHPQIPSKLAAAQQHSASVQSQLAAARQAVQSTQGALSKEEKNVGSSLPCVEGGEAGWGRQEQRDVSTLGAGHPGGS